MHLSWREPSVDNVNLSVQVSLDEWDGLLQWTLPNRCSEIRMKEREGDFRTNKLRWRSLKHGGQIQRDYSLCHFTALMNSWLISRTLSGSKFIASAKVFHILKGPLFGTKTKFFCMFQPAAWRLSTIALVSSGCWQSWDLVEAQGTICPNLLDSAWVCQFQFEQY